MADSEVGRLCNRVRQDETGGNVLQLQGVQGIGRRQEMNIKVTNS